MGIKNEKSNIDIFYTNDSFITDHSTINQLNN